MHQAFSFFYLNYHRSTPPLVALPTTTTMQAAWTQQANELLRNGSINAEEFFNLAMTDEEGGAEQLKILVSWC